ncbi:MAG TPA: hypothetical protein ENH33_05890 [Actinobacteria bacterium]|nr:hypothetical protein [Actinomycetota bacterium]
MKRLMAAMAVLVLGVSVTGCASAAEKVAEKVAEKTIEQSGGGDVSVEQSGSGDNTVIKVESEEGTMVFGGGEIPEGLTVPVPDGGEVTASISTPDGLSVSLSYTKADYDDIVKFYEDWTGSGDFQKNSFSSESGGTTVRSTSWYSGDGNISISVADSCVSASGDEGAVCVMIIQGS